MSKDDELKEVDQRLYRSMIGSLFYVIASRPDVMQAVGKVARFQATPKEAHVLAVKSIFIYLKGTTRFWIWYPKVNNLNLVSYTDANSEGNIDDRKKYKWSILLLG